MCFGESPLVPIVKDHIVNYILLFSSVAVGNKRSHLFLFFMISSLWDLNLSVWGPTQTSESTSTNLTSEVDPNAERINIS